MTVTELLSPYKARVAFLARYAISGGAAGILQTLGLYVWVSVLGLKEHYLWGVVIGFCVAAVVGFLLQKYWTFKHTAQAYVLQRQFVLYCFVALGGLALNTFLLQASKGILETMGFDFFHIWYVVAEIIVILFVATMSFLINYFFIFKSSRA